VLAQPIEVGVKSGDQARETGAEARIRYLWVLIKKDVVEVPQAGRRARALQRSAVNGKDALAESCCLLHLPGADFRTRRGWREHKNHRVGISNQVAEASLPVLAAGDAVAVDEALKAASIERCIELVGKLQIVAAIGDEDAKLAPVGRVGSARLLRSYLLWSYITGFQRSRTGCVMSNVFHCAPPPLHWILADWAQCVGCPLCGGAASYRGRITSLEPLDFCPSCPA
jgi:hypothetical protein